MTFSKLFHMSIGKIVTYIFGVFLQLRIKSIPDGVYEVIPKPKYISQLSGSDRKKVKSFYGPIDDFLAAKRFGTSNLETFSFWAWRSCGIVAVQIILNAIIGKEFSESTMSLVEEGLLLNGYNFNDDRGWYHSALVSLAGKFGVNAYTQKFVPPQLVALHVLNQRYVVVSVKSKTGGHLLVIFGVVIENGKVKSFTAHDPYDFEKSGDSVAIPLKKFEFISTRRIIVFER